MPREEVGEEKDAEMKEEDAEEDGKTKEDESGEARTFLGPLAGAVPSPTPHGRGVKFSEAWEYFYLAPARLGHHPNQYAICRLCGRQVSRGPGVNVGTTALWKHLKSMHKGELEKSGHAQVAQHPRPRAQGARPPPPGAEGDWARLLEQVGALALWASRRERAVERRERAVERRERAVERRERAVEEVEKAIVELRWKVRAEKAAGEQEGALAGAARPFHFA
ncbi:zinc finger BED domain-containing protein 2 [Ornithorhynchus anatinus]|uniref:zinc finger BED domain-containing protein 2 n=1 Tax=Ornithorhynchus anatinus TaxID=9258 RepID=UPI0010A92EA4|nr:zinc finger BED domain-containing protein 2 [Ornithorhynchus anatinus]